MQFSDIQNETSINKPYNVENNIRKIKIKTNAKKEKHLLAMRVFIFSFCFFLFINLVFSGIYKS